MVEKACSYFLETMICKRPRGCPPKSYESFHVQQEYTGGRMIVNPHNGYC